MIERLSRPAPAKRRGQGSPPARSAWVAPAFGASARAVSRGETPQERYDKLQAHLSRPRQKGEHVESFRNRIAAASALHEAHTEHHSGGFLHYVGGQAKQFAANFDPRPFGDMAVARAHELRHPIRYAPELARGAAIGTDPAMMKAVLHQLGAMASDPLHHVGDIAATVNPIGPHGVGAALHVATAGKVAHIATQAGYLLPYAELADKKGLLGPRGLAPHPDRLVRQHPAIKAIYEMRDKIDPAWRARLTYGQEAGWQRRKNVNAYIKDNTLDYWADFGTRRSKDLAHPVVWRGSPKSLMAFNKRGNPHNEGFGIFTSPDIEYARRYQTQHEGPLGEVIKHEHYPEGFMHPIAIHPDAKVMDMNAPFDMEGWLKIIHDLPIPAASKGPIWDEMRLKMRAGNLHTNANARRQLIMSTELGKHNPYQAFNYTMEERFPPVPPEVPIDQIEQYVKEHSTASRKKLDNPELARIWQQILSERAIAQHFDATRHVEQGHDPTYVLRNPNAFQPLSTNLLADWLRSHAPGTNSSGGLPNPIPRELLIQALFPQGLKRQSLKGFPIVRH